MPGFHVSRSIHIDAEVAQVFPFVRDFTNWPRWSPWLVAEPETRLGYPPDGTGYSWDGRITGSGEITVIGETAPRAIDCRLTFLKPWKSVSATGFRFEPKAGGTEVTWSMDGSLPIFLFWMKRMITAMLGSDFQRGLLMLKALAETGRVPSKLDFLGRHSFPGCHYVGVRTRCPIDEIGWNMERDFRRLAARGIEASGPPISIYHKWNPSKGTTDYTAALPVAAAPAGPDGELIAGGIPACTTWQIRHTGPYPFLGNAWAAGMMCGRAGVFKADRRVPLFEIYQNDPSAVPAEELVTLLYFPVK